MKRFAGIMVMFGVILASFVQLGSASDEAFHAELNDPITPITSEYLVRVIQQANSEGASLVLMQLDAPGGLSSSAREIVHAILDSNVPVVVYLPNVRSWKPTLNTMIALSADAAVMKKGVDILAETGIDGAPVASPVDTSSATTSQSAGESALGTQSGAAKVISEPRPTQAEIERLNFMSNWAREIAQANGRDLKLVEQAVRSQEPVMWEEAVSYGVVDLALDEGEELMAKLAEYRFEENFPLNPALAPSRDASMTFRESTLNFLSNPNIVYILLLVGIFALAFEFMSGGIGIGLIGGGISLVIAFMGLQVLPVSTLALILICFGALLMVIDVYYSATNGVLTLGGVIALLIGSFTLFNFEGAGNSGLGLAWYNIIITVAVLAGLFGYFVVQGLFLHTRQPAMGINAMIGLTGKAKEPIALDGEGMVFVHGEYWRAVPVESDIEQDEEIEVVAIEDGRLFVRKHLEPMPTGESV